MVEKEKALNLKEYFSCGDETRILFIAMNSFVHIVFILFNNQIITYPSIYWIAWTYLPYFFSILTLHNDFFSILTMKCRFLSLFLFFLNLSKSIQLLVCTLSFGWLHILHAYYLLYILYDEFVSILTMKL